MFTLCFIHLWHLATGSRLRPLWFFSSYFFFVFDLLRWWRLLLTRRWWRWRWRWLLRARRRWRHKAVRCRCHWKKKWRSWKDLQMCKWHRQYFRCLYLDICRHISSEFKDDRIPTRDQMFNSVANRKLRRLLCTRWRWWRRADPVHKANWSLNFTILQREV